MTIHDLTAAEAAALLSAAWGRPVSPNTLRDYVRRNKLRAHKRGPRLSTYPSDQVEALAANPPQDGRPRTPRGA